MADLQLVTQPAPDPGASQEAWQLVIDAIDEALAIPGGIEHEIDRGLLSNMRRHATLIGRFPVVAEAKRGEH